MFAKILYFMPEVDRQARKEAHIHTKIACTCKFISLCNTDLIASSNFDSRKFWQYQEFGLDNLCLLLKLRNHICFRFYPRLLITFKRQVSLLLCTESA